MLFTEHLQGVWHRAKARGTDKETEQPLGSSSSQSHRRGEDLYQEEVNEQSQRIMPRAGNPGKVSGRVRGPLAGSVGTLGSWS